MEIHAPHGGIHSMKDFLIHLLTVTIGILIALSLDGLLEWHHHRALVEEARANLLSEISENHDRLAKGLEAAPDAERRLRDTISAIEHYRKTHQEPKDLEWSFGIFPLASTAWTTAASTGAITYMHYSEVKSYTHIYFVQDQFLSLQQSSLEKWVALQKWGNRLDPKRGFAAVTPTELSEIEDETADALSHTVSEESVAKALDAEYARLLQEH
jgi:hypothetical protein